MEKGVFERIGELVNEGRCFVLCRVITAKGSTPRSSGTVMAVLENGETIGSVGGGKIEYDCIMKAREMFGRISVFEKTETLSADAEPFERQEILHFELYPDDSGGDYICGGEMDIGITPVTEGDTGTRERILELVREHRRRKVYIFGGGHVAQALVPVLAKIEFAPVVYEEREEFALNELFPEAEKVICGGFDRIGDSLKPEKNDFCAIMTRGHADDYTVLKQILSTNVEYIGLMGSRKKKAILVEKLIGDGFDEKDIARIHNPIGLDIGSETPEEIAISIAAELIAVRSAREPEEKEK